MYVVYEDKPLSLNLLACQRTTATGHRVYDAWPHKWQVDILNRTHVRGMASRPDHYAFPIGLYDGPNDWTGPSFIPDGDHKARPDVELFSHIPQAVMADAQQGKVLFILDSSHTGNCTPHLWPWFYAQCEAWSLDPRNVLFLTGDQDAAHSHAMWRGNRQPQITVMPTMYWRYRLPRSIMRWHKPSDASTKTHLFNCLNRKPHQHRKFTYMALHDAGLLDSGLVSMPCFEWTEQTDAMASLPLSVDGSDEVQHNRLEIREEIYNRSWLTLITESRIDKIFFSEQIFKPMLCHSPFIVVAKQGYLRHLRQRGFHTFPMLWNESYDDEPNIHRRIGMIMQQIKQISSMTDRASWLAQATDSLAHNHMHALKEYTETDDHDGLVKSWKRFAERWAARPGTDS